MTITKCRPTKVQCSLSPGSLLSETQDEALDVGHGCNPKNSVNSVLHVLFDAFPQNAFHFSLSLSHLTDWRTGCCWRMIHATVRHTCKAKSRGKLQFRNRHFVNSGVRSLPTPHPHQNNCGSIIFIPGAHCAAADCIARFFRARVRTQGPHGNASRVSSAQRLLGLVFEAPRAQGGHPVFSQSCGTLGGWFRGLMGEGGVHASQGSTVRLHSLALAPLGHAMPCLGVVLGPKGRLGTGVLCGLR